MTALSGFTICIPNYNYERYLGTTLDSILAQTYPDYEIVIADNQSTDRSVAIVQDFQQQHTNIRLKENPVNLGFAGNLDAVASMAERPYLIMLSSDDVMQPTALATYADLLAQLPAGEAFLITSAIDVIDSDGKWLRTQSRKDSYRNMWRETDRAAALSEQVGSDVYRVAGKEMLRRVMTESTNPFNFLATCFRRKDWVQVGGYGQGRMMNPDKWFHWRMLGQVDAVYYIDQPLFQYRWHASNQTAQEINSGHLKYITDEYRTSMEVDQQLLATADLQREDIQTAFIRNAILRHGLGELSKGLWLKAFRIYCFGWATYPQWMIRRYGARTLAYAVLLLLGPVGSLLLRLVKSRS